MFEKSIDSKILCLTEVLHKTANSPLIEPSRSAKSDILVAVNDVIANGTRNSILCESLPGEPVRTPVENWNRTFYFAAIETKDNYDTITADLDKYRRLGERGRFALYQRSVKCYFTSMLRLQTLIENIHLSSDGACFQILL